MRKTAFLDLAEKRRSVRAYKPDDVPEDLLQQVLEAGRLAPSACNKQPWRFIVVRSETGRRALGAAYARERDLFYQAASAPDAETARLRLVEAARAVIAQPASFPDVVARLFDAGADVDEGAADVMELRMPPCSVTHMSAVAVAV